MQSFVYLLADQTIKIFKVKHASYHNYMRATVSITLAPFGRLMKNYLDRCQSCNAILLNAVSALYYPITITKVEWPVISQSRVFFPMCHRNRITLTFCWLTFAFHLTINWLVLSSIRLLDFRFLFHIPHSIFYFISYASDSIRHTEYQREKKQQQRLKCV